MGRLDNEENVIKDMHKVTSNGCKLYEILKLLIRAYLKTQTSYINCTKSKNAVE